MLAHSWRRGEGEGEREREREMARERERLELEEKTHIVINHCQICKPKNSHVYTYTWPGLLFFLWWLRQRQSAYIMYWHTCYVVKCM